MTAFRAGDIFGCSGHSLESAVIAVATYGVPFWSLSHVAIVAPYKGQLALYESTMGCTLPCLDAGRVLCGVQVHGIAERIENYSGKIWHYPLTIELNPGEVKSLERFLRDQLGKPYDELGAIDAGGKLWSFICSRITPSYETSLFCSKLCADAHVHCGQFTTDNVNLWSPNRLMREELRRGIVQRPGRVR
jgi:hypothetical protein